MNASDPQRPLAERDLIDHFAVIARDKMNQPTLSTRGGEKLPELARTISRATMGIVVAAAR